MKTFQNFNYIVLVFLIFVCVNYIPNYASADSTQQNNNLSDSQSNSNNDLSNNTNINTVLAPSDAKISDVSVSINNLDESINQNPGFSLTIKTNMPVSPRSVFINMEPITQQEYDLLKNGEKLKRINNSWSGSVAVSWGEQESQEFIFSTNQEMNYDKENVIGKLLLIGIYTENGTKITNPLILFSNGKYEKLPIPPLQDVFTGKDYLAKTGLCPTDKKDKKVNQICNLIMSTPGNFTVSFDSNFAVNNPLLYVCLVITILALSIIIYVFLLISYFLTFILKKNPWGVIFDSKTLAPIEGAIVRIFDEERDKLLETKVTGQDGRFSFLPGSGEYYIRVTKPGYIFPSKILTYYHHPSYYHLYHGEEFIMKAANAMFVTNIPIDPQQQSSLTIKPPFIKKVLFDIARARWALIISFIILLGLVSWIFLKILSFTPGENFFVTARYLLIFLIPIIILEFYFWWNGGKVRILKKELTPAQKKDFASKIEVRQEKPVGSGKPKSKVWIIVLIVLVILLGAGFLIYSCRPSQNTGSNPTTQNNGTSNNNIPASTSNDNVNTDDGIQPTGPFQSLTSEQINCMKKNLSEQAYEEIVTTKRLPAADEEKALQSCNIPKP